MVSHPFTHLLILLFMLSDKLGDVDELAWKGAGRVSWRRQRPTGLEKTTI